MRKGTGIQFNVKHFLTRKVIETHSFKRLPDPDLIRIYRQIWTQTVQKQYHAKMESI